MSYRCCGRSVQTVAPIPPHRVPYPSGWTAYEGQHKRQKISEQNQPWPSILSKEDVHLFTCCICMTVHQCIRPNVDDHSIKVGASGKGLRRNNPPRAAGRSARHSCFLKPSCDFFVGYPGPLLQVFPHKPPPGSRGSG